MYDHMAKGRYVVLALIAWGLAGHTLSAFSEIQAPETDPNAPLEIPTSVSSPVDEEFTILPWMVLDHWRRMSTKMTPEQILEMLGEPREKEESSTMCVWYYQDVPTKLETGAIQRPRHGLVTLKKLVSGGESLVVKSWKEPNWYEVPCFRLLQYSAQQAKLEKARLLALAEQKRQEKVKLAEARRLEAEKRRQEELREQEDRLLAQQQEQQQKEELWMGHPRKYWYIGGGAVGGLAVGLLMLRRPA